MSEKKYTITVTLNAEATSATVFDAEGTAVTSATVPYERRASDQTPSKGEGAYRPRQIVDDMCEVVMDVLGVAECEPGAQPGLTSTVSAGEVAAVHFSQDVDDVIVWDIADGLPVCEALSADDARQLGISSRSVAHRIAWVLENIEGAREKAERGEVLYGDPACWLIWNLSGGVEGLTRGETSFATARETAEGTGLYDSASGTWSQEICDAVGIPLAMLPAIKDALQLLGHCRSDGVLPGVPIEVL
ncbi:MAG: hypothetical protein IKZ87_03445 [Actinomycetaceae bacterium]|nr:hypothetical protein [Actinomycetaceae bacterium]